MEDKRAVGREKEALAESYLKEQGYKILQKKATLLQAAYFLEKHLQTVL